MASPDLFDRISGGPTKGNPSGRAELRIARGLATEGWPLPADHWVEAADGLSRSHHRPVTTGFKPQTG